MRTNEHMNDISPLASKGVNRFSSENSNTTLYRHLEQKQNAELAREYY